MQSTLTIPIKETIANNGINIAILANLDQFNSYWNVFLMLFLLWDKVPCKEQYY